MNRDELIENLGTIARSGTAAFLSQLSGDASKDVALIGQFGVGFYSAFMVADKVEVVTRKAGENQGWRWVSDGKGEFTVGRRTAKPSAARAIVLHLRAGEDEFLEPAPPARDRQDLLRSHRPAGPARGRRQGRDAQHRLGAVDPAAQARSRRSSTRNSITTSPHAFDEPWLTLH